jgi:protein gp37
MNKTSIEWTDFTWNPVTGCHKISPGCKNCYAETMTNRFASTWGVKSFRDVITHPERLEEPGKNAKKWAGKKVFVCSMSDLFHEDVSDFFILEVIQAIQQHPNTIFQIPTKRPERALEWFRITDSIRMKLDNLWIGVSCEDQITADERIPYLLKIPAKVRFLSCEPLLGPINLREINKTVLPGRDKPLCWLNVLDTHPISSPTKPAIDWVIVGGESGHEARPMHPDWARSLRDQCRAANVPFFFKQWGEWVDNQNMPREAYSYNYKQHIFGSGYFQTEVWKAGKSKTGNLLDGVQHLNFPIPTIDIEVKKYGPFVAKATPLEND